MSDLYTEVNELVEGRLNKALRTGAMIHLPDMVEQLVESLADMIVWGAPLDEQGPLIEHSKLCLEQFLREKQAQRRTEDGHGTSG
jgi:hypothetical protein